MRKTYTLAEARDIEMKGGTETIALSFDFRKMLPTLNPPPPDYMIASLKEREGVPTPEDHATRAAYRFVNEAVPEFSNAAMHAYMRVDSRIGPSIPLVHLLVCVRQSLPFDGAVEGRSM